MIVSDLVIANIRGQISMIAKYLMLMSLKPVCKVFLNVKHLRQVF